MGVKGRADVDGWLQPNDSGSSRGRGRAPHSERTQMSSGGRIVYLGYLRAPPYLARHLCRSSEGGCTSYEYHRRYIHMNRSKGYFMSQIRKL